MPRNPSRSRPGGVLGYGSLRSISALKRAWSRKSALHGMHLADREMRRAHRRDAGAGDLRAEHPAEHPDGGEHTHRLQRTPPVTGRNPRQLADGQRRDDERREDDHDGDGDREICVPAAERVAHGPDADREIAPVLDRVERPVEGDEEAQVEELSEARARRAEARSTRARSAERGSAGRRPVRRRQVLRAGAARRRRA